MQIRRLHPDKQDAAVVVSFLSISCRREWDKQEGSTKKYCGLLSLSVPPYILYACPSEPPHVLLAVETPQAPVAAGYLDEEDPPKFYLAPPPPSALGALSSPFTVTRRRSSSSSSFE